MCRYLGGCFGFLQRELGMGVEMFVECLIWVEIDGRGRKERAETLVRHC